MTYREMTPEEKLQYNQEVLEALIKNSFMGADIVHEKWKLKLSNEQQISDIMEKTFGSEALRKHEEAMNEEEKKEIIRYQHIEQLGTSPVSPLEQHRASIYAAEHLPLVQEDLNGPRIAQDIDNNAFANEPKTKVLEPVSPTSPNPWGDAKTVMPGEVQELLKR